MHSGKVSKNPRINVDALIARQEEFVKTSHAISLRENNLDVNTLRKLLEVFKHRHDVVNIYIRNKSASCFLVELAKEMVKVNKNLVYTDIEEVEDLGLGVRRKVVLDVVDKFLHHDHIYGHSNSELYGYMKCRYAIWYTLSVSKNNKAAEFASAFKALCETAWQTKCFSISLICKSDLSSLFNIPEDLAHLIMSYISFEDIKHDGKCI
ncbi:MAG: hypothetical protein ACK5WS_01590 [Alphaproteobacteria bacterium]|jgi:hypothetical protein